MRPIRYALIASLLVSTTAQAGGLLSKLFAKTDEDGRTYFIAPPRGVKLLELEVVKRPAGPIATEFANLQFRVRQLTSPDPQYLPPPVRVRRFAVTGAQLSEQWLHADANGIYATSVPMRQADSHYLYFETGTNRAILKRVPWVVLRTAPAVSALQAAGGSE